MSKRIAITGNIGSGKTTVCRQFERLGIPVYYADARAKLLMTADEELVAGIRAAFGKGAYSSAGGLDRAYLAERVFGSAAELARLNALVHPAVARDATAWHAEQTTAPYTLHEAAITLEIGSADQFAAVVVVSCPVDIRRQRVIARDQTDAAAFEARAAKQWTDERKEAAADFLIVNDGRRLLMPQILRLDRYLRNLLNGH